MPRPYAAKGTVAAGFGDGAARLLDGVRSSPTPPSSSTPSPASPTAAPSPTPQPADEARRRGATTAPAQAGLGHEARGLADRDRARPAQDRPHGHGDSRHDTGGPGPRRSRQRTARRIAVSLAAAALSLVPAATAAHADGIRAQQWALDAMHTRAGVADHQGRGHHRRRPGHRRRRPSTPTSTGKVLPGKDLVGFGAERGDRAWARHGTAMAGIIAGHGHGASDGDGVMGIAPEAKILPVRVILGGRRPARAKAREHPRQRPRRGHPLGRRPRRRRHQPLPRRRHPRPPTPNPPRTPPSSTRCSKGSVVVASAGNGGEKGDHISYPAAYPGVIAVTAVDRYGTRAAFSTRRWYATVSAPGVDVVIADPDRKYYEGWGTSAAAAFVSGAVALVRAAHPDLTPAQIKKLLEDTARNAPAGGRDDCPRASAHRPGGRDRRAAAELEPERPAPGVVRREVLRLRPGPDRRRRRRPPAGPARSRAAPAGCLLVAAVVLWRGRPLRDPRRPEGLRRTR